LALGWLTETGPALLLDPEAAFSDLRIRLKGKLKRPFNTNKVSFDLRRWAWKLNQTESSQLDIK
jgi:hypothetical protein